MWGVKERKWHIREWTIERREGANAKRYTLYGTSQDEPNVPNETLGARKIADRGTGTHSLGNLCPDMMRAPNVSQRRISQTWLLR